MTVYVMLICAVLGHYGEVCEPRGVYTSENKCQRMAALNNAPRSDGKPKATHVCEPTRVIECRPNEYC